MTLTEFLAQRDRSFSQSTGLSSTDSNYFDLGIPLVDIDLRRRLGTTVQQPHESMQIPYQEVIATPAELAMISWVHAIPGEEDRPSGNSSNAHTFPLTTGSSLNLGVDFDLEIQPKRPVPSCSNLRCRIGNPSHASYDAKTHPVLSLPSLDARSNLASYGSVYDNSGSDPRGQLGLKSNVDPEIAGGFSGSQFSASSEKYNKGLTDPDRKPGDTHLEEGPSEFDAPSARPEGPEIGMECARKMWNAYVQRRLGTPTDEMDPPPLFKWPSYMKTAETSLGHHGEGTQWSHPSGSPLAEHIEDVKNEGADCWNINTRQFDSLETDIYNMCDAIGKAEYNTDGYEVSEDPRLTTFNPIIVTETEIDVKDIPGDTSSMSYCEAKIQSSRLYETPTSDSATKTKNEADGYRLEPESKDTSELSGLLRRISSQTSGTAQSISAFEESLDMSVSSGFRFTAYADLLPESDGRGGNDYRSDSICENASRFEGVDESSEDDENRGPPSRPAKSPHSLDKLAGFSNGNEAPQGIKFRSQELQDLNKFGTDEDELLNHNKGEQASNRLARFFGLPGYIKEARATYNIEDSARALMPTTLDDLNIRSGVAKNSVPKQEGKKVGGLVEIFQARGMMAPSLRSGLHRISAPSNFVHESSGRPAIPSARIVTPSGAVYSPSGTVCVATPGLSPYPSPIKRVPTPHPSYIRPNSGLSDANTEVSSMFGEQLERFEKPLFDSREIEGFDDSEQEAVDIALYG
jgi:hypothetical protein